MAELDHRIAHIEQAPIKIEHQVTLMDSEDEIFCMKFDPTDKYIACGCGDGTTRVFNLHTGKMAFLLANPQGYAMDNMPITCLRWRPVNSEMKTKNILIG